MTVILDASAAIEIILNRSQANRLTEFLDTADWIIAPDIFVSEITSVFWKYHQFENLSVELCEISMDRALGLIDNLIESKQLYREVFSMSCRTKHSVYDMFYLILSKQNDGTLVTLDKKLNKLAIDNSVKIFD